MLPKVRKILLKVKGDFNLNPEYKINLKLFYNIMEKKLDYLWQAVSNIDLKANYLLGFEGIILSVIFSSYSLVTINIHVMYIIGIILIFSSFFLTTYNIRCSKIYLNPNPNSLIEKHYKSKEVDIYRYLLATVLRAHEKNKEIIFKKSRFFNYSIFCLFIGILLIILSVILNLEGGCLQIKWK
jgi:hypothetical protein